MALWNRMDVVFTDLDGTLLDARSYSYAAAAPALRLLSESRIPLVLCTSKTRAETEVWRARLGNTHPFIVENGGAAVVPAGYFSRAYGVIEFGDPYSELVGVLRAAAAASGCAVRGFADWRADEIARTCGLPVAEALLAKQREYDEPFQVMARRGTSVGSLLRVIEARGKHWTRGGHFFHITGKNDKAVAVRALIRLFERKFGQVRAIGLGDGLNDAGFLNAVHVPFIIPSACAGQLAARVPGARLVRRPGPEGWNEAILSLGRSLKGGSRRSAR
jgi:mannosyl-3-phosphoglycerate phosphatase